MSESKIAQIPIESRGYGWLSGALYRFKREGYAMAEAGQIRRKLSRNNLETLKSLRDWFSAILGEGK